MTTRKENMIIQAQMYDRVNWDNADIDGEPLRAPHMRFAPGSPFHIKGMTLAEKQVAAGTEAVPEGMKLYTLKDTHEHWYVIDGERMQAIGGDKVPLSDTQYASFKDKFIPLAVAPATAVAGVLQFP